MNKIFTITMTGVLLSMVAIAPARAGAVGYTCPNGSIVNDPSECPQVVSVPESSAVGGLLVLGSAVVAYQLSKKKK